jgi:hypothetical protein
VGDRVWAAEKPINLPLHDPLCHKFEQIVGGDAEVHHEPHVEMPPPGDEAHDALNHKFEQILAPPKPLIGEVTTDLPAFDFGGTTPAVDLFAGAATGSAPEAAFQPREDGGDLFTGGAGMVSHTWLEKAPPGSRGNRGRCRGSVASPAWVS